MSKKLQQERFNTPPMLSVSPAPEAIRIAQQKPHKMRFHNRLSTPNVAVMMRSPNISPIPTTSIRSLDFDSPRFKLNNKGTMERPTDSADNSFNSSMYASPMEKSFRAPLNDHLDLKVVLKEYELSHLATLFEANGVNLSELSEMTEQNFIDMGIFKLNELDKLKRICNLLNDSQNTSY